MPDGTAGQFTEAENCQPLPQEPEGFSRRSGHCERRGEKARPPGLRLGKQSAACRSPIDLMRFVAALRAPCCRAARDDVLPKLWPPRGNRQPVARRKGPRRLRAGLFAGNSRNSDRELGYAGCAPRLYLGSPRGRGPLAIGGIGAQVNARFSRAAPSRKESSARSEALASGAIAS
jgi:hypothetical protein